MGDVRATELYVLTKFTCRTMSIIYSRNITLQNIYVNSTVVTGTGGES